MLALARVRIRRHRTWIAAIAGCALLASSTAADPASDAAKAAQLGGPQAVFGPTVSIDNGVSGDGRLEVVAGRGGETVTVNIDPSGASPIQDIMFELSHYIDVGVNGGALQLGQTTITQEPTLTGPNEVTSAGTFAGPNGSIAWTAVSAIPPGSTRYVTTISFSSASPFGTVRVLQYADIDVPPFASNDLVQLGAFGEPGFQLVTAQNPANGDIGLRQVLPQVANASCIGWAAMPFPELRVLITGAGTTYTPAGNVVNLSSTTDARFPGAPAFGPADITSAIACDLNPAATSAIITLGVSAEGEVTATPVPTLSEWALIALAVTLAAAAVGSLRRRRLHAA